MNKFREKRTPLNPMILTSKSTPIKEISLAPTQYQQERRSQTSQQSEAIQLDLIALLDKKLEPAALRIEIVPANVTVGRGERFCLVHQVSQLQIPGQFSNCEAEQILKLTHTWDWTVNLKTRVPACRGRLLNLLEDICTLPQVLEVAA